MFGPAGLTYVYLIYGMYHCLNIVTDLDEVPSAVLIRALDLETIPPWIDCDRKTTNSSTCKLKLDRIAAGPGKLCRALKIDLSMTAQPLQPNNPLWLEHRTFSFQQQLEQGHRSLIQTTRIGLTHGTDLLWRWYLKDSSAVSKQ
jgi:DNA-3-methyladenine glycosylase